MSEAAITYYDANIDSVVYEDYYTDDHYFYYKNNPLGVLSSRVLPEGELIFERMNIDSE